LPAAPGIERKENQIASDEAEILTLQVLKRANKQSGADQQQ
jgi:hypothetical protein